MQYIEFGATGARVSRLGFGCMRLPLKEKEGKRASDADGAAAMLRKGYELGVNYFDTAYMYHGGNSERILGTALRDVRDKVFISTKSPGHKVKKPGDYRRILEEQLQRLDMPYIDFYHFHGISYDDFREIDKKAGWLADAHKAKDEGLIRYISFSFHGEPGDIEKLTDMGCFDSLLCQYNVLDRSNEEGMAYARQKGLGVAVMGPLGGGRISGLPKETAEKLGVRAVASAELGLRFVATNPNVDIILSGMSSETQLVENVEYLSRITPLTGKEISDIAKMVEEKRSLAKLYCTGCNYCMPCPQDVNIPYIFEMANYYKVYSVPEYAREGYASIGGEWIPGKRAGACTECGECETKCPQKIKIMEQLKESHSLLCNP